jgi:hypothetical protein
MKLPPIPEITNADELLRLLADPKAYQSRIETLTAIRHDIAVRLAQITEGDEWEGWKARAHVMKAEAEAELSRAKSIAASLLDEAKQHAANIMDEAGKILAQAKAEKVEADGYKKMAMEHLSLAQERERAVQAKSDVVSDMEMRADDKLLRAHAIKDEYEAKLKKLKEAIS